ncbi:MAG: hypothetical protein VR72_15850 [Clostridiaceae bacterium BRH_c20a]|nr:MAG: hypothetical protein VR72_15850 [Clostridiaceae bacterium BRH_c20a]
MDLEFLVQVITREIIKKVQDEGIGKNEVKKPEIMVVYTGGSIGFVQSLRQLDTISKFNKCHLVLSNSAARIYKNHKIFTERNIQNIYKEGEQALNISLLLEKTQLVIIPVMTFNTMAKIAMGICDNLVTNLIFYCLTTGIPVISARNAADLQDPERKKLLNYKYNPGLIRMGNDYMRKLEVLGIKLVDITQLEQGCRESMVSKEPKQIVKNEKKKIITQEDITPEVISQGFLKVPANYFFTPLAQDIVKSCDLKIYKG